MVRKSTTKKQSRPARSISPIQEGQRTDIEKISNGFIISKEQRQSANGPYKPPKKKFVKTLPKELM